MKYRLRNNEFEAIRYMPHESCREVAEFCGMTFDESMCTEASSPPLRCQWFVPDGVFCNFGEWLVRDVDGEIVVFTDDRFQELYEEVQHGMEP